MRLKEIAIPKRWRPTINGGVSIGLMLAVLLLDATRLRGQSSGFFSIQPGKSSKAEMDLKLGEPVRKMETLVYEYAPPKDASDTERIVATFFPDTLAVARLDVYLKVPLPPEPLRQQLGSRVMVRDRVGGGMEEIYYPKLNALVFSSKAEASRLSAISYLSARLMADFYVDRFNEYLRDRRYEDAQTEADKAVLVDPDYARGYVAQGICFQQQKNDDEAIVRFIAATNAKYTAMSRSMAHTRLGTLYWEKKKWLDKAEAEFQRAISLAPKWDEAHFHYGSFLLAQKKKEDGKAELAKAVELNPENVRAQLGLGDALYSGAQYDKALPHYEMLSRWAESGQPASYDDAERGNIQFRYAYCLGQKGETLASIHAYAKALQKNPNMVNAYLNMGLGYQKQRETEKAVASFRGGLKIDPKNLALNQKLGETLLEAGRVDEAQGQMDSTLRIDLKNAQSLLDLARCWGARGKKKQTLYWLSQAVEAGYQDRAKLTSDRFLALVQKEGDFKKLLLRLP